VAAWFFRKNGGAKTGPYSIEQIKTKAQKNPDAQAMQDGVMDWTAVQAISALGLSQLSQTPAPAPATITNPVPSAPPPLQQNTPSTALSPGQSTGQASNKIAEQQIRDYESEGVDYRIYGAEMQFVEVELDPNESVVAEAGGLMYKDPEIEMETIFGDGSESKEGGFLGLLAGAGRRLITGESLFTTVFTHKGHGKAQVSFAAPYAGNIIPFHMKDFGGTIVCQKDSFLCASKGVAIGIHFSKKIMTGLFGGEGFILQKLTASANDEYALSFVHAGGTIIEKELQPGQVLEIDTGTLVAMTSNIDFDVRYIGSIKSAAFGGEGLFLGTLRANGKGKVWLQSLPFARLAARIISTAQGDFGSRQGGEGSLLGGIGGLLNGDNR